MRLDEFLAAAERGEVAKGDAEVLSEWLDVAELNATSGSLWAGDPFVANAEDGYLASLPPASYRVQAQGVTFPDGQRQIARLRVVRSDVARPELGPEVGETGTDSALMSVCDIAALEQLAVDPDVVQAQIEAQATADCGIARLGLAGEVPMIYVATGSDGSGPAFELRSGGTAVGFELDFMPPE